MREGFKINANDPLSLLEEFEHHNNQGKEGTLHSYSCMKLVSFQSSPKNQVIHSIQLKLPSLLSDQQIRRTVGHRTNHSITGSCPILPFGLFPHVLFRFQLIGIVCLFMSVLCCSAFSHSLSCRRCSWTPSSKAEPKCHFLHEVF